MPDLKGKPTAEDIEKAKVTFQEGRQLFEAKDFEKAVEKFKEAYRLSKNPLLLYNIGYTHDELGQVDLALFYYEKYITDVGKEGQVFEEVKSRVEALKRSKEAGTMFDTGTMKRSEDKPAVTEFMHTVIEEAPPGYPLDISAFIPENSGWQVTLYYRASFEDQFSSTIMQPRYSEIVGRIPASKTAGKTLQYYIEVRDKNGELVERSGRSASPNLVFIDPNAKPRFYPDLEGGTVTPPTPGAGGISEQPGTGSSTVVTERTPLALTIGKWTATGTTVALAAVWIGFYVSAGNYAEGLESDALLSRQIDQCAINRPCRSFSNYQKDVNDIGRSYERTANIFLAATATMAIGAGVLWYLDLSGKLSSRETITVDSSAEPQVTAVPVIGQDFVGAAASFKF